MSDSKFVRFQQICTDLRLKTTNCEKSQVKFGEAKSVTESVAALRMFWVSVVEQVPSEFISVLDRHYEEFREEVNSVGIYYNETPSNPTNAVVFVGNCPNVVRVMEGRPRVIVLGPANVVIGDHVRCESLHESVMVECYGHSRLHMTGGYAVASDYSTVEGSGTIFTQQCATAYINGGTLFDYGHKLIKAYNNAIIYSFTHRKIELLAQSQLKDINE